jgi:hypothetical protein
MEEPGNTIFDCTCLIIGAIIGHVVFGVSFDSSFVGAFFMPVGLIIGRIFN